MVGLTILTDAFEVFCVLGRIGFVGGIVDKVNAFLLGPVATRCERTG